MDFLYMNLTAALMIFAIVSIRAMLKNKIPYIAIGILWVLAIMRLYIPFHFKSDFSIYNGIYYLRSWLAQNDLLQVGYSQYYIDRILRQLWAMPEVKATVFIIWFVGVILISRYYLKDHRVCRKIWQTAEKSPLETMVKEILSNYDCNKKISIRQSDRINCPVACGVFYHGIIIPANLKQMNQKYFEQILLHEYMHHKYKHPLLQHILVFILCLNWFNPAIWLFYHFASRDTEISCDRHVMQIIGEKERKSYALNLVNMAGAKEKGKIFQNGFAKKENKEMKERIVAIMKFKKFSALAVAFSMLIPTTMASAFCTDSNYVFGDEINDGELIVLEEHFLEEETLYLTYEELKPYITGQETRATSKINIDGYKRTYSSADAIPTTIKVSMERDGYTYTGTLKLVNIEKEGSTYIGYYSGTLYRQ